MKPVFRKESENIMTANRTSRNSLVCQVALGVVASGLLLVAGCTNEKDAKQAQRTTDQGVCSVNAFAKAQASEGARQDATLYSGSFDGPVLNSLGRAKLDRIMYNYPLDKPLTIYLDIAKPSDQNKLAVTDYLKEKGFPTQHVTVKVGSNPDTLTPSQEGLTRMTKMETPDSNTPGTGTSTGTSTGTGMSTGGYSK
jgi:hypothetical protein